MSLKDGTKYSASFHKVKYIKGLAFKVKEWLHLIIKLNFHVWTVSGVDKKGVSFKSKDWTVKDDGTIKESERTR